MIGHTISHYRILEELGSGGRGVVYRAVDVRLGREVALKFLSATMAADPDMRARFDREARQASRLNHPNICTVHDVDYLDGRPFIVMERCAGESIKDRIDRGPIPVERGIDIAIQLADALEAAHARGILHRELNPANVFVSAEGQVKIVDFGLPDLTEAAPRPAPRIRLKPDPHEDPARPDPHEDPARPDPHEDPAKPDLHEDPAKPDPYEDLAGSPGDGRPRLAAIQSSTASLAAAVATARPADALAGAGNARHVIAYISPELAAGHPPDERSDLYALGAVLLAMLVGGHAGTESPPASSPRTEPVPPELEAIVERLLAPAPGDRYPSASALLADLRALKHSLASRAAGRGVLDTAAGASARVASRSAALAGRWPWLVPAGLVVALAAAGFVLTRWRPGAPTLTERDVILLAGFENRTGQPVFDDTLAQALAVQLLQSPFFNVVADDRVRETLRQMGRPADARLTRGIAREVCERLGLKAMVGGTVSRRGSGYDLALEAASCTSGATLARTQGEAATEELVLQAVGRLSSALRTRLGESLRSVEQFDVPIAQATTPSLDALKAYTLGLAERDRGAELESIAHFERALELDPAFAAAATTLSTVYGNLGEPRRSEEYARRAYENRARVSERERFFIEYQYHHRVTGNLQQAITTLEVWKQTYPSDFRPANALAIAFNRLGRYDRGVEEAREALRRSPGHPFALSNLAHAYRGLGRYAEARQTAEEAVRLRVETVPTRRLLYQLAVLEGDAGAAGEHLTWAAGKTREFDVVTAQAQVAAYQGRVQAANGLYERAVDLARRQELPESAAAHLAHQALMLAFYGERPQALAIARAALAVAPDEGAGESVPRFRAVTALALLGDPEGLATAASAAAAYPEATFVSGLTVPAARAAYEIHRGNGSAAVQHLAAAAPYETGTVAVLVPAYLRGQAYLLERDGARAAGEFTRVLDHRGADPFSPVCALAQLGLARAWRLQGDTAKAVQAYDAFLDLWRSADPAVPVFAAARQERADLERGTRPPR
jgi:serine/threonine protein kinase/tetratricopeptide (TPR) repeat protein